MEKNVQDFIISYLNRTISDSDLRLLEEWLEEAAENRERFNQLTRLDNLKERVAYWNVAGGDKEKAWQSLLDRRNEVKKTPIRRFTQIRKYWQMAAAIVVFVVGAIVIFKVSTNNSSGVSSSDKSKVPLAINDVQPGKDRAVLTLADGRTILLDNSTAGHLAKQGDIDVVKGDGSISYVGTGKKSETTIYNTLKVPRGGQYRLLLGDGTKVWLNAESSIRYPTIFKAKESRSVDVTGEVYFEVAKQENEKGRIPFIVGTARGVKIDVVGTHFNVNAYDDEENVATTLTEGKVKVISTNNLNAVVLKPGEQAIVKSQGSISVNKDANIQAILSWKNRKFYFSNMEFAVVMRQISRWYNIDIIYEGKVPSFKLNGEASRNESLATMLTIFSNTGIRSRIEGNKLFIPEQN